MKNIFLLTTILLLANSSSQAAMTAYFSYTDFNTPSSTPYIETYIQVVGKSVHLVKNSEGKYQSDIAVEWEIKSGDSIIRFDKYVLHGPQFDSLASFIPDFIDKQRISIANGNYTLDLNIKDQHSTDKGFNIEQKISVNYPDDKISISSIEFLESYSPSNETDRFTKNGFKIVPYVNNFYPKDLDTLKFYCEIYNAKKILGDQYLVRYMIGNEDKKQLLENFVGTKRQPPSDNNVLIGEIPIHSLYSGNYDLIVEVVNKENKVVFLRQVFFQRSNTPEPVKLDEDYSTADISNSFVSSINSDSIIGYLLCLSPIQTSLDRQITENLIRTGDPVLMKKYFYSFWRGVNPGDPENAWAAYKIEVIKVNASYSSLNYKGYETDRGRVYLQYGPPNAMDVEKSDPNSYPYEIWQYYKLKNQSNRKFVFYATDHASNDYHLLHSDAIGELQDPAWELKLHSRTQMFNDLDQENSIDTYGSKAKDEFSNPH